ncbi:hypothetical protein Pan44_49610 [Caulifigura coniformis]|uniref:Uncharacterized protein n=1 Tax=Caulifigura coniformis TaxID=2527983 RepID=A0A517SL89_9PLAN|nr:hypothetical protein [Caulifigura coniformis]QDT56899.1 hypothetical protein Pan44_49610 [Caulifigura coniformis]
MSAIPIPAVLPDVMYPLATFEQTFKVGRHAMRQARRDGLKVKYSAGKGWLLGRDWIDHVQRTGADEHHRDASA